MHTSPGTVVTSGMAAIGAENCIVHRDEDTLWIELGKEVALEHGVDARRIGTSQI